MEAWSKEEGGALGNPEGSRTAPERLSAGGGSEAAPASWRCAAAPGNAGQSGANSSERARWRTA